MKMLYICYGNLNRSPLAKQMTEEKLERAGITDIIVDSAGFATPRLIDIPYETRNAMQILGYNPKEHTPKKLTRKLLAEQDLVLCMSRAQEKSLRSLGLETKIHTISEFTGSGYKKIPDPIDWILNPKDPWIIQTILKVMGYADPSKYDEVIRVHVGIAKLIEKYVEKIVARVAKISSEIPRLDPWPSQ